MCIIQKVRRYLPSQNCEEEQGVGRQHPPEQNSITPRGGAITFPQNVQYRLTVYMAYISFVYLTVFGHTSSFGIKQVSFRHWRAILAPLRKQINLNDIWRPSSYRVVKTLRLG